MEEVTYHKTMFTGSIFRSHVYLEFFIIFNWYLRKTRKDYFSFGCSFQMLRLFPKDPKHLVLFLE